MDFVNGFVLSFMCFVKVRLWSMVILKSLTSLLLFTCLFSTINVMLLFIDDPRNFIWNLPGLATILLIRNQFGIISAKLQTSVFLIKNIKSFMKRLNKIGANIDPCGTFLRIPRYELKVAPIFTRWGKKFVSLSL